MPRKTAIARAVAAAGGQGALAKLTGYTQPAVHYWLKVGQCAPAAVLDIERHTGIPRHELRPDLYPQQEALHG